MITFNKLGNLGRLGNQMFQYASLRGIAANRRFDFCIPPKHVFGEIDPNVKNSKTNIHTVFDLSKCNKVGNPILYERVEESGYHFDENIFNNCPDNVDLYGYFQSEKYFKHIEDEIRGDFTFHSDLLESCKEIVDGEMGSNESISLHVRRSDYLNLQSFHPTPPIEYYTEALEKFPEVPVFIFSDDPDWCMQQKIFDGDRFLISKNTADFDLCLMSMCKYHIIANSSFSWWGAWLSKSNNVIAPKVWFGESLPDHDTSDLYCDGWERL
jgi:hypothetical protein